MIIYNDTLSQFKDDVINNMVVDKLLAQLRENGLQGGTPNEIRSWYNSLRFMKDVLDTPDIPGETYVAVEYNIPQTSKRVDFMILGKNEYKEDTIVIVELKQWGKVSKVDDASLHSIMSDLSTNEPVAHPSYQAYTYKVLISNYCDDVKIHSENLIPCAYLHNLGEHYRGVIEDELYSDWVEEAPVFLSHDALKLRNFIKQYIKLKSDTNEALYAINEGKIKPQKSLQDAIDSMLCGNEEFKMIDEQAVAYDKIMNAVKAGLEDDKKHVVIISGGPGTGKSVLAINVLAECISKLRVNASYITKNMAPRKCYSKLLARGNAKKEVNLAKAICSPYFLANAPKNSLDVGIFDEAHRMQKSPYMYYGKDMLEDAIYASKVSIFFVDDDQRITVNDCYTEGTIIEYGKKANAVVHKPFRLVSQFRCGGSDGYIAFLNNTLGIEDTANFKVNKKDFEIKVFDDPNKLRDELRKKNDVNNKSRMVAGYCYDWNVKYHRGEWDIMLPNDFKAKWNLEKDDIWAINPKSFEEVGCIHTCQGMEFDYVGVFIGKDLRFENGKVITDKKMISRDDKTSGIRLSTTSDDLADKLIRNTYKVLLSRGMKGCYIYCEDEALRNYLKRSIEK